MKAPVVRLTLPGNPVSRRLAPDRETDLFRFKAQLLLRMAAIVFAVALAAHGNSVRLTDGVGSSEAIHQGTETGAEK